MPIHFLPPRPIPGARKSPAVDTVNLRDSLRSPMSRVRRRVDARYDRISRPRNRLTPALLSLLGGPRLQNPLQRFPQILRADPTRQIESRARPSVQGIRQPRVLLPLSVRTHSAPARRYK